MRDLPRVVWVLAAGRFVGSASSFMMLFLTLYLVGPRGLAVPVAGLVAGSYGAGMLLGNLTGGRWGDRFGHRRVLLGASTVVGAATTALPWLPTAAVVAVLPVTAYLGATGGVSTGALAASAVPRGDRRTSVALGRAASNAGFVLGPPLAALLVSHSYAALFVVDGLVTIAVRWAVGAALPPDLPAGVPADPGTPRDDRPPGLWSALRRDRAVLRLLPAVVLVDLVYRQLYTTLPLHLRDAGQPVALYAALVAVGSAAILALEIPVALRLRRRPPVPIITTGYLLVGVGFALFALPVGVATTVVAMLVLTAGEILYKTTATAYVLDAAPDHLLGQYQGLYTAAATSGTLLSAPLGTAVYAVAPGLLWPLCLVVCVLAAGLARGSDRPASRTAEPGGPEVRRRVPG